MKRKEGKARSDGNTRNEKPAEFPSRARNVVPMCAQLDKRFALSIWEQRNRKIQVQIVGKKSLASASTVNSGSSPGKSGDSHAVVMSFCDQKRVTN